MGPDAYGSQLTKNGGTAVMILVAVQQWYHLLRDGLQLLLEAEDDIAVVGPASSGVDLIELCGQSRPDVLVRSVNRNGTGGSHG